MQGDRYFATIEFANGMSPSNANRNSDNLAVSGKLAVRAVEEPTGVIFYAVPPPDGNIDPFSDPSLGETPMERETVGVVSARAKGLEEENARLRGELAARDERITFLLEMNRDLHNFLMDVTKAALGQKNGTVSKQQVGGNGGKEEA